MITSLVLDSRTLLVAIATLQILCGLMILTALGPRQVGKTRIAWAASFLLQGTGIILLALRDHAPDWLSIPVANTLFLLGSSLTLLAFADLLERRVPLLLSVRATAVYAAVFAAFYFVGGGLFGRTLFANAWIALLHSGIAWVLLQGSAHHPSQRMTGVWFCLMAGMLWLRLVVLLGGGGVLDTPVSDSIARTVYMLCALGTMLASALGYLLIENELRREELVQLARLDSLTGALNRRALEVVADTEWERHSRYRLPLAVLMVDIDHFKAINDNYGHSTGDAVLRHFSHLLRSGIRQHEVIVRYGGEEFMILAPNTDLDGAVQLAERIQRLIRTVPFDSAIVITASFGVAAQVPLPDSSWRALVETADQRLYRAKAAGRDCIVIEDGEERAPA